MANMYEEYAAKLVVTNKPLAELWSAEEFGLPGCGFYEWILNACEEDHGHLSFNKGLDRVYDNTPRSLQSEVLRLYHAGWNVLNNRFLAKRHAEASA